MIVVLLYIEVHSMNILNIELKATNHFTPLRKSHDDAHGELPTNQEFTFTRIPPFPLGV